MYRYICGPTLLFKQPWFQSFYFNIWRRQSAFNLLNTWQNDFFMKRHFEKNITSEVNLDLLWTQVFSLYQEVYYYIMSMVCIDISVA